MDKHSSVDNLLSRSIRRAAVSTPHVVKSGIRIEYGQVGDHGRVLIGLWRLVRHCICNIERGVEQRNGGLNAYQALKRAYSE